MKKMLVLSCLLAAALVACGPKSKGATAPNNTQKTETKSDGAMGGQTYGGAKPPAKPAGGGTDDPCAAH